jgi:hypothetical protein
MYSSTVRAGFMLLLSFSCSVCFAACPSGQHLGDVRTFAFSPDAKRIAALAEDGTLFWWDAATGTRTQLMDCLTNSISLDRIIVFSPDSSRIAVAVDGAIQIFELPRGLISARLTGHGVEDVREIVFSADGRRLAASHKKGVTVWALDTQKELLSIPDTSYRFALALNHDGSLLAVGVLGGIGLWRLEVGVLEGIDLWNLERAQPALTIAFPGSQFAEDLLFVGENTLVSALAGANGQSERGITQYDREITIWNAATGAKIRTLEGQIEAEWFRMVATTHHALFAFSYGETMRSWDLDTGRLTDKMQMPPSYVSADGKHLLRHGKSLGELDLEEVGRSDGEVRPFIYRSPRCAATIPSTSAPSTKEKEFELLFFGDGLANDGTTMIAGRGYTSPDCTRLNVDHGEFPSEEAAKDELHEELKWVTEQVTGAVVEQGPMQVSGFVYGERALVRFPATRFHPEHAELLLTDGKHFYRISSPSLQLVLEEEKYFH